MFFEQLNLDFVRVFESVERKHLQNALPKFCSHGLSKTALLGILIDTYIRTVAVIHLSVVLSTFFPSLSLSRWDPPGFHAHANRATTTQEKSTSLIFHFLISRRDGIQMADHTRAGPTKQAGVIPFGDRKNPYPRKP